MKWPRFAMVLSIVVLLISGPIAIAATEDEQWQPPRDYLRMTPIEDAPHAVIMEDVANENLVYSFLYGEKFGTSPNNFARYICASTSDGPCQGVNQFNYNSVLPICQSESDLDCVIGISAIDSSGNISQGVFKGYSSPNHPNNFAADTRLQIPKGVTGGIWNISGAPHAFGSDYVVYANISGIVNAISGPNPNDPYNLSARIVPVSTVKTTKRETIWGCTQDKALTPNAIANTRCGPFYEQNEGFRCIGPAGDNNDQCLSPHAFPSNIRFKLDIRFSKSPIGWLHGRLIDSKVSITQSGKGFIVSVEASPAKIPSFFYLANFSQLPPEIQSFWEYLDKQCSVLECGQRSSNNYEAPIKSQTTMLAALNYGKQALEAVRLYLPLIKDTASANPSTWSWRTLSTNEMQNANNCFTDGVGVKGIVTTNASAYSAGPPQFINGELKYQVAAPHFQADGTVFKGDYNLVIDSKVARCLYKFSSAPVSATITVVNDKGEQSIATTSVTESDGWLRLTARNFEFSSPSISIKLQQDAPQVSQIPIQQTTTSEPSSTVKPENNPVIAAQTQSTKGISKSAPTKTTITCKKGKLSKKVTAVAPRCPVGYTKIKS